MAPEDSPAPQGKVTFDAIESSILVGATDSVVYTFVADIPTEGVYRLRTLNIQAEAATATTPAISVATYVQPHLVTPDQPALDQIMHRYGMRVMVNLAGPSHAIRIWELGIANTGGSVGMLSAPSYFKGDDTRNPQIELFDATGGVAVLTWFVLMEFDYWTVSQFQYGLDVQGLADKWL